jgi:hypothetical protein
MIRTRAHVVDSFPGEVNQRAIWPTVPTDVGDPLLTLLIPTSHWQDDHNYMIKVHGFTTTISQSRILRTSTKIKAEHYAAPGNLWHYHTWLFLGHNKFESHYPHYLPIDTRVTNVGPLGKWFRRHTVPKVDCKAEVTFEMRPSVISGRALKSLLFISRRKMQPFQFVAITS